MNPDLGRIDPIKADFIVGQDAGVLQRHGSMPRRLWLQAQAGGMARRTFSTGTGGAAEVSRDFHASKGLAHYPK